MAVPLPVDQRTPWAKWRRAPEYDEDGAYGVRRPQDGRFMRVRPEKATEQGWPENWLDWPVHDNYKPKAKKGKK